jgi:hypothetical protein
MNNINLTDKFPVKELNNYLVGRNFIRVSPLTGAKTKGIIKNVTVIYDGSFFDGMFRPVINITSTNDVTYDYNEIFFDTSKKIEKRSKIVLKIEKGNEEKILGDIDDI